MVQEPALPAMALPNLIQLLLCEALNIKTSAALLNRLLNRPGIEIFSEASVVALRSKLGAERLSDLCGLDAIQIWALPDLAPDEKSSLVELCERLRQELPVSTGNCWNFPALLPVTSSASYLNSGHGQSQNFNIATPPPSSQEVFRPAIQAPQTLPLATPKPERMQLQHPQSFQALQTSPKVAPQLDMSFAATPQTEGATTSSAPDVINSVAPGQSYWPEHEAKHFAGECKPCAYYFKPDSCKWGGKCDFCHLCPASEIKTRKKEKIRAMRDHALRDKNVVQTSQVVSVSLSSALKYPE